MKEKAKTKYQIALSAADGVSPQKYEIYDTKEEAQSIADKRNKQDNNPYGCWIVIERK